MDKQQQAPVLTPFFRGDPQQISPVWQRWFQKLKTRDDEIRKKPAKILTADADLTTWDLGTTVLFDIGTSNVIANLPPIDSSHLWAWITIVRLGTGRMGITADAGSRIEYSSLNGTIYCTETRRRAANVTLQIIDESTWAIIAGLGIWDVD